MGLSAVPACVSGTDYPPQPALRGGPQLMMARWGYGCSGILGQGSWVCTQPSSSQGADLPACPLALSQILHHPCSLWLIGRWDW